jgi:hypothetical protein
MASCSPLGEVAANATEVENIDEVVVVAELEHVFGEDPAASDGEKCRARPDIEDTLKEGVSDDANSKTYYFGLSTISVDKIKEMEEKGYFLEDEAHTLGVETVLEPNDNEAVVYEDFFVVGLCMPPHLALPNISLHFQLQLH